ncbi:MAG: AAA family ATPase [Lachnospiraceae bacterium]|nr:AAA family ATPase [Lachnospiraceae bacterium]
MNMKEAKMDIRNTIEIYLKKDEFGDYRIPLVRQRPIFLLGAPGIGKTAVVEQIAQELHLALVSYSMTHHTRQSALGLPFIQQKSYGGVTYDVSEYTMSEIIASVYDTMEESGIREGILFLDEINCVSETLAPAMLQFLQYKVFGRHRVPEGWVIVTAGNPPMYNKSVREFDIVTMDRLKVMEVEPDFSVWKEYAMERGIHSAIVSFLELKKEYFYHIETTGKGRSYVTARGWEDLSQIILLYEENGLKVDEALAGQYLRNEEIVREFCAYYDLYQKYKNDYQVKEILNGNISQTALLKAQAADFDERLSLLGMLLEQVQNGMREAVLTGEYLQELTPLLRSLKQAPDVPQRLGQLVEAREKLLHNLEAANTLSGVEKTKHRRIIQFLLQAQKTARIAGDGKRISNAVHPEKQESAFDAVKEKFDDEVAGLRKSAADMDGQMSHLFAFVEAAFGQGNEMLILVTELTVNQYSARYLAQYGCEPYRRYSEVLMLSERQNRMREELQKLELQ